MKAQRRTVGDGTEGGKDSNRVLLTLVVPTRNEADNVPELVRELRESLADIDYRLVFVDDSTDGTPDVIRDLAEKTGGFVWCAGRGRSGVAASRRPSRGGWISRPARASTRA